MAIYIKRSPLRLSRSETTLLLILCFIPVIGILVATKSGVGISPDSVGYISAGLNFADGDGLTTHSGAPLVTQPPGLPVLIAAGQFMGADIEWTVRIVNSVALVFTVLFSFTLLRRHVPSRPVVLGGTLLTAISGWLLAVADKAWTEPIFIVTVLAFIIVVEDFLAASAPRNAVALVVLAASLVWASFLIKYVGIFLIPTGIFILLLDRWRIQPWISFAHAATFAALSSSLPTWLLVQNMNSAGSAMGPRYPSSDASATNALRTLITVGQWILPGGIAPYVSAALGGIAILGAGTVLWHTRTKLPTATRPSVMPLVVVTAGYAFTLVAAASSRAFDIIDNRLLSPIYVPCIVLGAIVVSQWWTLRANAWRRTVVTLMTIFLVIQGVFFARVAWRDSAGVGYAAPKWRDSQLIRETSLLPDGAVLSSNVPEAVWLYTRRSPVLPSPKTTEYRSTAPGVVPEFFLRNAACNRLYLVWFYDSPHSYSMNLEQLSNFVKLNMVAEGGDGAIYRVGTNSNLVCKP